MTSSQNKFQPPGYKRGRRKTCSFCKDNIKEIDYKDVTRLKKFLNERAKIISRRVSGNCAKHQRKLAIAIKRARTMALLPYTNE